VSKERSSDPKKQPRGKKPPATPSRGQGDPMPLDFEELFGKYRLPADGQPPAGKPPATPSGQGFTVPLTFEEFLKERGIEVPVKYPPTTPSRGQGGPAPLDFEKYGIQDPVKSPPATGASGNLQQFSGAPIAKIPPRVREIDLSHSHVTGFREQGTTAETFLSEERRMYPNNSKGKMTKNISVSNSVTREVTIEKGKLTSGSANAGVTFVGFGAIEVQVQRQLNQHYSVTTDNSVTISEQTTIEIPPASTVEHIIRWKLIWLVGIAILGETPRFSPSLDLAEVPYKVPFRLTYTETLNDVPRLR
jgi:hypothetical protein